MADSSIASIVDFPQPPKRPKTAAERAKAYRERKRARTSSNEDVAGGRFHPPASVSENSDTPVIDVTESNFAYREGNQRDVTKTNFGYREEIQRDVVRDVTPEKPRAPSVLPRLALIASAVALAGTGIVVNGWYARSLGSTETAGWLFLAIGIGADCAALALPSVAASLWDARQRARAAVGWLVWLATFVFAVTAGIGFASVNIADVTASRSSRVTPAVQAAQAALADAMAARDRECKGGVGKFCREREAAVAAARDQLALQSKGAIGLADPQTDAAVALLAWISGGTLKPTGHDFAMLRLILLALLPQIGGVLLMLGRTAAPSR